MLSGKTFKATVIGTDASAGLALLQLAGSDGRAFSTLAVGNLATLVSAPYDSKQFSYHLPRPGGRHRGCTSGTQDAIAIDVGTLIDLNATNDRSERHQRPCHRAVPLRARLHHQ